jgi:hypothetical protein
MAETADGETDSYDLREELTSCQVVGWTIEVLSLPAFSRAGTPWVPISYAVVPDTQKFWYTSHWISFPQMLIHFASFIQ